MSFFSSLQLDNVNNKETTQPLTEEDDHCYRSVEAGQFHDKNNYQDNPHDSSITSSLYYHPATTAATMLKQKAHALRRQRCRIGMAAVSVLLVLVVLVLLLIVSMARRRQN
eukprot:scaffold2904_cov173-Amphora_coffeaeformis.AAC.10